LVGRVAPSFQGAILKRMDPSPAALHRIRWYAAILAFSATSLTCADPTRPIVIAFASNMGSPSVADIAQAALHERRRPGERPILVFAGDSGSQSNAGGPLAMEVDRAIRFAANEEIVAVVGPGGSREALQTTAIYQKAGLPNVIPTATSRRLSGLGPWTFLLAPDDSVQGEFIGTFGTERLAARSVTIMYLPDEYGQGLAAGSRAALAQRGITVVSAMPVRPSRTCPPAAPRNSYDDVALDVLRAGTPDLIVLAARTSETACIARAVSQRAPGTQFVAGDGVLVNSGFLAMAGPAADSIYFVAFWDAARDDPASRAFVTRFRARFGREPRHDEAMFYDGVMLVGEAIRTAGPSRTAIRQYLEELGRTRPPYPGITGPISFAPGSVRPLLMTRLNNGRLKLLQNP
jgi:branched-chain amino acid transport system substrate-binding protein